MYPTPSKLSRLAALKTTLVRSDHLGEGLIHSIVVHTCGSNPLPTLADLQPMISAQAWTDVGLSLIGHQLPDWCVTRLCLDDGLWWCGMNPRQPVYWTPCEVDEPHPVLSIAVLKAYVTALIRRDCATISGPAHGTIGTNYVPAHCV